MSYGRPAEHAPLLAADAKAYVPNAAPIRRPPTSLARRVLGALSLLAAAWLVWLALAAHRTAPGHACADAFLNRLRDEVRWEELACRIRGQPHSSSCRSSFDARNRDAEQAFLQVPRAASARAALQRYTTQHHLAGEKNDYLSTLRLIEEWSELLHLPRVDNASHWVHDAGSVTSRTLLMQNQSRYEHQSTPRVWADTYSVWLDQPVRASLALTDRHAQPVWTADLREDVLAEDPTSQRGLPPFHGYSHAGRAAGPLVYAGEGQKADFALLAQHGVDFRGKIVLVRYGGVFRGLKVRAAQEVGAAGVLIYSDLTEDDTVTEANGYAAYPAGPARQPSSVQRGSVQALSLYPGDPATPGLPSYRNATRLPIEEAEALPKIPSLPISYQNALRLLASLRGHGFLVHQAGAHLPGALPHTAYWSGPSEEIVHMNNEMDMQTRDIWNVYAVIPGYLDDQRIVIGNHRDAWSFGGVDPSSGTAVVHEVLRGLGTLLQRGWKPTRTIVVASWDAEEYGLVGSTEFGEDYPEHTLANVAAYLNLDMAVEGSQLSGAASPSLKGLLRDAAADVRDPRTGAPLDFGPIDSLGSGSDFTVFLQRIGIAASDISFRRQEGDPVYHYHSNYDSFTWLDTFGDPGFLRHEALAKVFGLMTLRAAQPALLPINVTIYAEELYGYFDRVQNAAAGRDAEALARLRAAIDRVHTAAVHLERAGRSVEARFRRLRSAPPTAPGAPTDALRTVMRQLRTINRKLKSFESGFIDTRGLPTRPWYRHLGVAPGRWLGYGSTTFPGVTEAYTLDGGKNAAYEIARLEAAINRIAAQLQVRW